MPAMGAAVGAAVLQGTGPMLEGGWGRVEPHGRWAIAQTFLFSEVGGQLEVPLLHSPGGAELGGASTGCVGHGTFLGGAGVLPAMPIPACSWQGPRAVLALPPPSLEPPQPLSIPAGEKKGSAGSHGGGEICARSLPWPPASPGPGPGACFPTGRRGGTHRATHPAPPSRGCEQEPPCPETPPMGMGCNPQLPGYRGISSIIAVSPK